MASTINCGCHSIRSMFRVLGIYNFGFVPKGFGKWQSETELAVKSFRQEKYMVENQAWKIHQDRVTKKMYQEDKCDCRLSWNCQERINQNGNRCLRNRVSVQGFKSLGGHFACLCRGFEFYEVNFFLFFFFKRKW